MRRSDRRCRLAGSIRIGVVVTFVVAGLVAGATAAEQPNVGDEPVVHLDLYGDPLPPGAVARLGSLRDYIGFESSDVVLSPDGKTVTATSGYFDIPLRLWDVATGRVTLDLKQLDPPTREPVIILAAAFSPDGTLLAAGDTPESLCLWSVETGQAYRRFPHQDAGHGVVFTPDGKRLITGGRYFRHWDIDRGQEIRRFPQQEEVQSVAFGPEGASVVTADGTTVRLWESSTGRELRQFRGHRAPVLEVAMASDGRFLASGDINGTLIVWEPRTGREIRRLADRAPAGAAGTVTSLDAIPSITFAPNRKTLAATVNRGASLWDVATGQEGVRFPRFNPVSAGWQDAGACDVRRLCRSALG